MLKTSDIQDPLFPGCPIRNVLSRVGDKWSMLVLYTLVEGQTKRFSELRRALPDISQKMLTSTLRTLEEDGFVNRKVYPEVPPRVEYTITDRGAAFMQACQPVIEWTLNNMAAIVKDRSAARK